MEAQAVFETTPELIPPYRAEARHSGRILLAEDDVQMRRLIATVLRGAGHRVVEASDGTEVLERVESTIWHDRHDVFGLIVSDMSMPALTGLDVLAALRSAEVDTPFILITAYGDAGVRAEAEWLGAFAVLDKPFTFDQLERTVTNALRGVRERPRLRRPSALRAHPTRTKH
jgi:CheY-like chemotaxis protein